MVPSEKPVHTGTYISKEVDDLKRPRQSIRLLKVYIPPEYLKPTSQPPSPQTASQSTPTTP
jgi:hypothetical protein